MNRLSVIIPAYNAAKTVERTIRSVFASTIPMDVWVVDDGSIDGTGELLDSLKESNKLDNGTCLHVIHQQNCGAYQARLNALKQIETPFFGFVDADDTIEPTMFEEMLDFAEQDNLDVVQCVYEDSKHKHIIKHNEIHSERILKNREEVYKEYIYPKILASKESSFIWDKIYRNQYDFSTFETTDQITNFDDLIFNFQFFLLVQRMGFIDKPLYHYSTTDGSAVHCFSDKKIRDFREAWRIRNKLAPKYGMSADNPVMHNWTLLNARSAIITAATAMNLSISNRARLVKTLAHLTEVKLALSNNGIRNLYALIVVVARCFPGLLVVFALDTIKKFR